MANVQLALVPTFVLLIPAQSVLQNKSVWINYATKQENGHLHITSQRQKLTVSCHAHLEAEQGRH